MAQKNVVFEYPSHFRWVFSVIRNTQSTSNGLWIGASIFDYNTTNNSNTDKNDKLLLLLNKSIVKSLEKYGNIKPGNLLILQNQSFLTRVKPNDDFVVHETHFISPNKIPNNLNIIYISDPLNIFNNKNSIQIKNKQINDLNNKYLIEINDLKLKLTCEINEFNEYKQ
eukprot:539045_1